MPELPEVETVCRALAPHLRGRTVRAVHAHVDRLRHRLDAPALNRLCANRRITAVRRRAKYIVIELAGCRALVLHLGMTGHLRICAASEPRRPHDRVGIDLSRGEQLRLNDPRRFAAVIAGRLARPGAEPPVGAALGPEPLGAGFTTARLFADSRGRKAPIKNLIMDQAVVVGVGNIYASESLWRAHVRPDRPAGSLSRAECRRLVGAIRRVLRAAVAAGGTTIADYRRPDGTEGGFARRLQVYGHAGDACPRCGPGRIVCRTVQGGRSTFFCPGCQR